jgi:hypothetical protein
MRRTEFGRILLWCGLTNLVLVAMFVGSQGSRIHAIVQPPVKADAQPANGSAADAGLAQVSSPKSDLQLSIRTRDTTYDAERTYAMTVIYRNVAESRYAKTSEPAPAAASTDVAVDATPDTQADGQSGEQYAEVSPDGEVLSGSTTSGTTPVAPLLRRNPRTGKLEIGNFNTLQLSGTGEDCVATGQSMLDDLGMTDDSIVAVAESDQISIARICASNGSVILSCRNDVTTISPRRPRPDDKCTRDS